MLIRPKSASRTRTMHLDSMSNYRKDHNGTLKDVNMDTESLSITDVQPQHSLSLCSEVHNRDNIVVSDIHFLKMDEREMESNNMEPKRSVSNQEYTSM